MPAVLSGGSRLQFEISKNGGETWDAAGQVALPIARYTSSHVTRHTTVHELLCKRVSERELPRRSQL
jgi:hypothetical protein